MPVGNRSAPDQTRQPDGLISCVKERRTPLPYMGVYTPLKQGGGRNYNRDSKEHNAPLSIPERSLMRRVGGVLTKKQRLSAKLFYEGYSMKQISSLLQVNRSTVWRWYQRPDMVRYARGYYLRRNGILVKKRLRRISAGLDSSDGIEANRAANCVLDECLDIMLNATK